MGKVTFNFNKAETHNGDKYFFICQKSDGSGEYYPASEYDELMDENKRLRESLLKPSGGN